MKGCGVEVSALPRCFQEMFYLVVVDGLIQPLAQKVPRNFLVVQVVLQVP